MKRCCDGNSQRCRNFAKSFFLLRRETLLRLREQRLLDVRQGNILELLDSLINLVKRSALIFQNIDLRDTLRQGRTVIIFQYHTNAGQNTTPPNRMFFTLPHQGILDSKKFFPLRLHLTIKPSQLEHQTAQHSSGAFLPTLLCEPYRRIPAAFLQSPFRPTGNSSQRVPV